MITATARLAGIIGWPVAHSRSPLLHNHWLARHGIDGAYIPLAAAPEHFTALVQALRHAGFRGANVTIPHKQAAHALCTTLDPAAGQTGAVNTLVFTSTGIHGANTDGAGFLANLRDHDIDPKAGPALILGAGGAARAIAAALLTENIAVTIANRTAAHADALAAALPILRTIGWADIEPALADHAMLVNTTSLGMAGHPPLTLSLARAPQAAAVADIVYVPLETPLLAQARARNLRAIDGLGMLLHQAVPGFAAWFGVTPQADEQTRALIAASLS